MDNESNTLLWTIVNVAAVLLSPLIALSIGDILQRRNQYRAQRFDVLRRIISFSYQLHPDTTRNDEFLSALLEIKFWYHRDRQIIGAWMTFHNKLVSGADGTDELYKLMELLIKKEKLKLSHAELVATLYGKYRK